MKIWNEVIYEGTELLARAFCHEIDHLDGKMYTDLVEGELHRTNYDEDEEEQMSKDENCLYGNTGFCSTASGCTCKSRI